MKRFVSALNDFIFPSVCVSCGDALAFRNRHLCDSCIYSRFEAAAPFDPIHLPAYIKSCYSMWQFDKDDALQELMHLLKYQNIPQAGVELGCELGLQWLRFSDEIPALKRSREEKKEHFLLLPVPLHPSRFRKRGYNQAEKIARGISDMIGFPLCPQDAVVRVRRTTSQTGLRLQQREKNIQGAFQIRKPAIFKEACILLVDDVFTTGATTFELASKISICQPSEIHILTVAIA